MISKNISQLEDTVDMDMSVMAAELDTSPRHLKYIARNIILDSIMLDGFDRLTSEIKNSMELISFDDNTVLHEWNAIPVILFEKLGERILLFEDVYAYRIEAKLISYRDI